MMEDEDFGTNSDGNKNNEYCKFCFQNGKFTDEGISFEPVDRWMGQIPFYRLRSGYQLQKSLNNISNEYVLDTPHQVETN